MATNNPKRGDIWLVDLDPTRGQEIKKRRPVIVLSADPIGSVGLRIVADAFKIKCVSVERFIHRMGAVSADTVKQVAEAVAICIDL